MVEDGVDRVPERAGVRKEIGFSGGNGDLRAGPGEVGSSGGLVAVVMGVERPVESERGEVAGVDGEFFVVALEDGGVDGSLEDAEAGDGLRGEGNGEGGFGW